jgi:hypothetical protein
MVLVLSALTSAAFGAGVIVGLAIGGFTATCVDACREARRVGAEEPPSTRPVAREEQSRRRGRTTA